MLLGVDSERVGADLVCRVAVGGDPVRPDDHRIDLPGCHERGGGAVCYEGGRQTLLDQLVSGQAGAWKEYKKRIQSYISCARRIALLYRGGVVMTPNTPSMQT